MRNALWRDRGGATAITFGILAVPVLLGVGLSVDYATMSKDRALVQGIADRALLASAMMPSATDDQISTAVNAYISAEKNMKVMSGIDSVTVTFPTADRIRLRIGAHSRTSLMSMVTDQLDFVVTSEALRGLSGDLEVAIALDTTASMNVSGKLDAAKAAAKALVDKLAETDGAKVQISLVPFAAHVSVGTANSAATWLEIQAESTTTCKKSNTPTSCTSGPGWKDGFWVDNASWTCVYPAGTTDICETKPATWNGCVGSRNAPLDVEAGGDASAKIPGVMNVSCGRPLVPLTTSLASIKSEIDALSASGDTYMPAGMLWGLNMLTPGAPLSNAAPFDPDGKNIRPHKALVLMTDGKNSRFAQGAKHTGDANANPSVPNGKTKSVCDNAKAQQIAVYTIAFQVADTTTKSLLEACATDPSYYYDAADSTALIDAFKEIAKTLKKVRLAR